MSAVPALVTRATDAAGAGASRVRSAAAGVASFVGPGVARVREWGTPLVAAVRRRATPVLEALGQTVSPLGWLVTGGALVLGVLGWRGGWLELRVLAVMLAVIALIALAFTLGRWHYRAGIDLHARRVRIGDTALGRVLVSNTGTRASASTLIELPVGRNVAAFTVPRLAVDETHEEVFQVPARRRGVITIGPVRSVRSDPLGLFHRQRHWTDAVELYVHPATVRLEAQALGFLKDLEGVTTQNLSSSDVSFHALRDYVPGDDRRAIHWRTTARVGRLMVRQFEETMRSHLLLLLSLRPEDYATDADFELAVSVVGSLGQAAVREERQVTVFTSAGPLEFATGPGLLDALCRVERIPGSASVRELAARAAAEVPSASVLGLVTGGLAEPADLRAAQVQLPDVVSSFALRCAADQPVARRRASSLVVLDVASLTDLQRGMRTLR